jgi:serine/threonine protein kinase
LWKIPTSDGSVKWIRTPTKVAIKKLDYDRVIRDADNSAERPMEEIKAMQYLQRHIADRNNTLHDALTGEEVRARAEQGIMENNIMTSIDVLTDNVYLYLIMPFCDGRELFDVVQAGKFSEPEARHWFKQILKAVETLQEAGVCHRDMSLENIMTSGNDLAIVIDFGMCLKIPYITDEYGNRQRCLIKPDRACGKVSRRS